VERYHEAMLRLAASFAPSHAVAEEVVQDTWLAVLRGLDGFEGRSSLKSWLFRILVNRARTTGTREHRSVPVADPEPAVDPARFGASGAWADPPEHWIEAAERRVEAGKLAGRIRAWLDELPARQREVVLLRDVEELVTDYLEGALSRPARRRFEAHLAGCPHCTEYLAQMRETIRLTGRLVPEDLTPQMRDEFVELYLRWRSE